MHADVFVLQTHEISMGRPVIGGSSDGGPGRMWWSSNYGYPDSHYSATNPYTYASHITNAGSDCHGEDC